MQNTLQLRSLMVKTVRYLGRTLLVVLAISLLVGGSFLFTRNFSLRLLVDRLFWVGIAVIMMGGLGIMSIMTVGNKFGLPDMIRKPSQARVLMDNNLEIRDAIDKRYEICFQFWLIGILVVILGALIDISFAGAAF